MPSIPALPVLALLLAPSATPASAWTGPRAAWSAAQTARLDLTPEGRLLELRTWMDRYHKAGHRVVRGGWRGDLTDLAAALRAELPEARPERRDAVLFALLDLCGIATARPPADEAEQALTDDVRKVGQRQLDLEFRADPDEFLARWLAHEVLARPDQHPRPRVLAAIDLLDGRHLESTQLALFSLVLHDEQDIRQAAVRALAGWPSPFVDEFLAGRLESLSEMGDDGSVELVQEHFAESRRAPTGRTARELLDATTRGLGSQDWRETLRTLDLAATLPDFLAVPALIEGLEDWVERRERGLGRRRVEGAIVEQLERRSGRRMGVRSDRWRLWWKAVLAGEATTTTREAASPAATRTTFFGLRPVTDRVVFVIDRSRSMSFPFGTADDRSRFDEAIDQLSQFLDHLGPAARFRLVLFDHEVVASSRDLRPADERQISAARRWMRNNGPRGGTVLQGGIETALRLDRKGVVDLERLEADTVIVLCDGETEDGTAWIEPLLETANHRARLVFHCVQIGGEGGGALEELAERSGGQFVAFSH